MREYVLTIGDREYRAGIKDLTAEFALISVSGKEYRVEFKQLGKKESLPEIRKVEPVTQVPASQSKEEKTKKTLGVEGGAVKSPLPGMILEIKISEGDSVKAGQVLLILEAMKMENQIQAPHDGKVKKINFRNGDTVSEGEVLCEIDRPFMTTL